MITTTTTTETPYLMVRGFELYDPRVGSPMTKREFDAETKENYGCHRGDRTAYRDRCLRRLPGDDFIARRAIALSWERPVYADGHRGAVLATLGVASPFRAVAACRARMGRPLLAGRAPAPLG